MNITGLPTRDVKTQRQIRQHVMRDIGRRRRKMASPDLLNLNLTPAHFNAGNPLASSSDSHDILSEANDGAIRNQEELEAPGVLSTAFVRREGGLSMGISRFSAGRIDPFVPWPVDLDARTRRLIDHREYQKCQSPCYHILCSPYASLCFIYESSFPLTPRSLY